MHVCMCMLVLVWSIFVHVGSVSLLGKCLCIVGYVCELETSGHFGRGHKFVHCRVRVCVT